MGACVFDAPTDAYDGIGVWVLLFSAKLVTIIGGLLMISGIGWRRLSGFIPLNDRTRRARFE
jgi:hypothetical protein